MIGFRGRSRSRSRSPRRRDRSRSPRYSRSRSRSRSPAKRDKDSRSVSLPLWILDTFSLNGKMLEYVFFRNKTLKFVLANRALHGLVRFNILIINSVWLKDSSSSFLFGFDLFESRKALPEKIFKNFWKEDVKFFCIRQIYKNKFQPRRSRSRSASKSKSRSRSASPPKNGDAKSRSASRESRDWSGKQATLPRRLKKKNFA